MARERERVKRKIGESKRKNKQTNRAAENELKIKAKAAASARNANELKNLNERYLQPKRIAQLLISLSTGGNKGAGEGVYLITAGQLLDLRAVSIH